MLQGLLLEGLVAEAFLADLILLDYRCYMADLPPGVLPPWVLQGLLSEEMLVEAFPADLILWDRRCSMADLLPGGPPPWVLQGLLLERLVAEALLADLILWDRRCRMAYPPPGGLPPWVSRGLLQEGMLVGAFLADLILSDRRCILAGLPLGAHPRALRPGDRWDAAGACSGTASDCRHHSCTRATQSQGLPGNVDTAQSTAPCTQRHWWLHTSLHIQICQTARLSGGGAVLGVLALPLVQAGRVPRYLHICSCKARREHSEERLLQQLHALVLRVRAAGAHGIERLKLYQNTHPQLPQQLALCSQHGGVADGNEGHELALLQL